ncbi:hypothetical protein NC653_031029 [Populus alba x Populus x berolinensis]|uniref:Uncharacterized protein n=1 Tax=Populus alba x Populus x berolinensis TaxID=444605 RepID=A0AAD6LXS1_9ROSI|nr:hypothetical protein NC653_031029 [Populus alba x Populus x berolinensis]
MVRSKKSQVGKGDFVSLINNVQEYGGVLLLGNRGGKLWWLWQCWSGMKFNNRKNLKRGKGCSKNKRRCGRCLVYPIVFRS